MYSLFLLTLLGTALAVPLNTNTSAQYGHYRLPGESHPTLYDVRLIIDPGKTDTFNGTVTIRIIPDINTQEIVLQAMEMTIESVEVFTEVNPTVDIFDSFTLATDDTHFLRLRMTQQLVALQPITVNIVYVSKYAENMFGLYVSTFQQPGVGQVNLVTSQLQPTFGRRAFPCYDEPKYKAVFRTTIYAPPAYPVVRTNMPVRTDLSKPAIPGFVKFEFQDTVVQSSYLLAFLVSNFGHVSNEANEIYNVPFRVYSRPGTQNTAAFALDFGQRNMLALEQYTQFRYALPKLDKVAVPDFAAGAMENWGLVIYREIALLVTEGVTTTSARQSIAIIICHENMHMWFGNEVSPQSWTYTWLNEGFANFFENFGTEMVLPEWRIMDQYVLLVQGVFQNDAVLSVNPMTHPVYTPSQIIGTFNAVAYQKSGSVIRMMQHFLTPEVFRRGLVLYLVANSRTAVTPPNLYVSLQQALDESSHRLPFPVATIMERWTTQGGFPVLSVERQAATAQSISIAQRRYLTDPALSSSEQWHVPVNWVLSTNPNFNDTSAQAWLQPNSPALAVDIPGLSDAEWYIINKQQTGYYRVNYDLRNWRALANALQTSHEVIHLLNRAQIVDDSFNLARTGRLDYEFALDVSRYLVNESDYIPWGSANNAFAYLDVVLSGTDAYPHFQEYVRELSAPLYQRLGFVAQADEEHVTAFHRNIVLNLNCRHGNAHCVNQSQELLQQFRNNPNQRLNPDIQTVVFCSGLRGGDVDNFNFLWERYRASQDSSEQSILLNSLACTSNPNLRNFFLNQVVNSTTPVREQDRHTIVVATINSSPEGMEAALDFVLEHFASIQNRVQGLTGTANILNAFARRLTTSAHSQKINTFVSRYQNIFSASELAAVGSIRENLASSIAWSQNNYQTVRNWFDAYYRSSAIAVTSSFIIFISFLVTIINQ
ncbi:unnamed protein product [Leptosia nina]|uniref:Aminopeptidase n=1 Tax=Leptosia nina TaxID=320188 RepID=A0AAV1JCM7_9NEOP